MLMAMRTILEVLLGVYVFYSFPHTPLGGTTLKFFRELEIDRKVELAAEKGFSNIKSFIEKATN